jgi:hypothetical protein
MPPNQLAAAIGQLIVELILLPFLVLRFFFRLLGSALRTRQRWHAVPLETKSHIRLRTATFALVVLIGASAFRVIPYDNAIEVYGALAGGGYALLNLGAGLIGVLFAASLRHDPLSIWWWSVAAASCVALLVYGGIAGW